MCVILVYSILYYRKIREDIEVIVFEVNLYDICVSNQIKSGKQQTVPWHVYYLKSSHVDPKVNDNLAEWCEETFMEVTI